MKLKCLTKYYNGWDEELRASVTGHEGEMITVSDTKGKQMLADFPTWFEKVQEEQEKKKGLGK